MSISAHDVDYGKVNKVLVNSDKTSLLSCADDGTIYVYKFDFKGFEGASKGDVFT